MPNFYTNQKPNNTTYTPSVKEQQFIDRWSNCRADRQDIVEKWNKIEDRLYRSGWEKQKLLTQRENLMREALRWNVADHNVTSYRPEIKSIDLKHAEEVAKVNKVVNSEWDRLDIATVMQRTINDKLIYGFGVNELYCDPKVEVDNKIVGELKLRRIAPRNFFADPNAKLVHESNYFFIKYQMLLNTVLSWDFVKDDFALIKRIIGTLRDIDNQLEDPLLSQNQVAGCVLELKNPKIDVFTYYYTALEDLKIVYKKAIVINSVKPIIVNEETLPFNFFPISILFDNKLNDRLYGNSLMEQAYFFQVAIDETNEVLTRALNAQKMPIILIDEQAKINIEDINTYNQKMIDGEIVARVLKYKSNQGGKNPLQFVDQSSISKDWITQYQIQLDGFRRQMNLSGIATSESTNSLTTKGGVALAQEKASGFSQASLFEVRQYCKKIIKILLYSIKNYYKTQRSFSYIMDELSVDIQNEQIQKFNFVEFKGSQINDSMLRYDIRIDSLTKSQQDKQAQDLLNFFSIIRQYQDNPSSLIKESDLLKSLDVPNKEMLVLRALVNEYKNRRVVAEQAYKISEQAVFLQVLQFFNSLEAQKLIDPEKKKQIAYWFGKYFQVQNVDKLMNADESPNMGQVVQQLASILEISIKK